MNYNNIELITPPEPPQSFYASEVEYNKKLNACLVSICSILASFIPSFDSLLSQYGGMSGKLFVQEAQLDALTARVDAITNTTSAEVLAEELAETIDDLPVYEPEAEEPESEVTEPESEVTEPEAEVTEPEAEDTEPVQGTADAFPEVESTE